VNPVVRRLRRYFLVGLVVIAPVGLTVYILSWLFRTLDSILGTPLQNFLNLRVPGLGFLLLALFVLLVGWVVHRAVGRQLLHWWNQALARFPLTGRIYTALSQIVQSVVGENRRVFRRTVLVPYPVGGLWAVGFVTNEEPAIMSGAIGEPCVTVFLPTPPNPATGFLLVVPRNRVLELPITIDEAVKLVLSVGAVSPTPERVGERRRGLDLEMLLPGDQR
jgi:uncharacterized membrane protein